MEFLIGLLGQKHYYSEKEGKNTAKHNLTAVFQSDELSLTDGWGVFKQFFSSLVKLLMEFWLNWKMRLTV